MIWNPKFSDRVRVINDIGRYQISKGLVGTVVIVYGNGNLVSVIIDEQPLWWIIATKDLELINPEELDKKSREEHAMKLL